MSVDLRIRCAFTAGMRIWIVLCALGLMAVSMTGCFLRKKETVVYSAIAPVGESDNVTSANDTSTTAALPVQKQPPAPATIPPTNNNAETKPATADVSTTNNNKT